MTPTPAAAREGAAELARAGGGAVPRHVAIIMDGNGRWAAQRGLPRVAGHRAGAEAVRKTLRAAGECGVEALTLYAFSSENWRRPEDEISDLKGLLGYYLERELELARQGRRPAQADRRLSRVRARPGRAARRGGRATGRKQPPDPGRGAQLRIADRDRRRGPRAGPQGEGRGARPRQRSTRRRSPPSSRPPACPSSTC